MDVFKGRSIELINSYAFQTNLNLSAFFQAQLQVQGKIIHKQI